MKKNVLTFNKAVDKCKFHFSKNPVCIDSADINKTMIFY